MRIVFVGASGHGKVCSEIAQLSKKYEKILFLDDNRNLEKCADYPVLGVADDYREFLDANTEFFVSIGNYKTRKRICERIWKNNGKIATLIHPDAVIGRDVSIGEGAVVMAGAVINTGARIGDGGIINTCASVDHDCIIGDYSHMAVGSHMCGAVMIGTGCWVGAGAVINNNLTVCDECTIGSGAVVVKNIDKPGTYIGVPAWIMQ